MLLQLDRQTKAERESGRDCDCGPLHRMDQNNCFSTSDRGKREGKTSWAAFIFSRIHYELLLIGLEERSSCSLLPHSSQRRSKNISIKTKAMAEYSTTPTLGLIPFCRIFGHKATKAGPKKRKYANSRWAKRKSGKDEQLRSKRSHKYP